MNVKDIFPTSVDLSTLSAAFQSTAFHRGDAVGLFLARYASWNRLFGPSVSALAGRIGMATDVFRDPSEKIPALADRSVLVASYVFDAARDEFDDRDDARRDTHRCLSQAMAKGLLERFPELPVEDPPWLTKVRAEAVDGYVQGFKTDLASLFFSMGVHVGSELYAHEEFSYIHVNVEASSPDLFPLPGAEDLPGR